MIAVRLFLGHRGKYPKFMRLVVSEQFLDSEGEE